MPFSWKPQGDRFLFQGLEGMVAFTTTRGCGISSGEVDLTDFRELVERCGLHPAVVAGMEQVHGGSVRVSPERKDTVVLGCDGLVTHRPGVALVMRSADCLPLIVYDPGHGALGLGHAGWRGLRARLPVQLVHAFRSAFGSSALLEIGIGPGIGPCCYEVGSEFEPWFPGHLEMRAGRRFLDLGAVARAQLTQAGVPAESIYQSPWCTSCTNDCFSHRREGPACGRMMTCAMIL